MGDMMEFGDTVLSTLGQARQAFQKESPELATAVSARTICWTKSMLMPLPFLPIASAGIRRVHSFCLNLVSVFRKLERSDDHNHEYR